MTRQHDRRGAAMLMALLIVILLEGLAALTLAAATSRLHLVAATRDGMEGRAVVTHALAEYRVHADAALRTLADGDSLAAWGSTPIPGWQTRLAARRRGALLSISAEAVRRDGTGRRVAARRATLLLAYHPADTLRVISNRPRW